MDNKDGVVSLPAQAVDMLNFLQHTMDAGKLQGDDPATTIAAVHDYACYWLHAQDQMQSDELAPITRLN